VLIDRGSASSAEILAGAIQDHDRGKLIGARTFGAGTVLNVFSLSDGSALKLAVSEWLTPKGRRIWHEGISPDIAVTLSDPADVLQPEMEEDLTSEGLSKSSDKQLLTAVDLLKKTGPDSPH
jgi:carboxyl-terminal processing protease